MELNDTNAKKAYEAVIEALSGMDNVEIDSKQEETLAISGKVHGDYKFKNFLICVEPAGQCITLMMDLPPFYYNAEESSRKLPYIANTVNLFLLNGYFFVGSTKMSYIITNRYNSNGSQEENVETVRYMFAMANRVIAQHGDVFEKIIYGKLSLDDFHAKYNF